MIGVSLNRQIGVIEDNVMMGVFIPVEFPLQMIFPSDFEREGKLYCYLSGNSKSGFGYLESFERTNDLSKSPSESFYMTLSYFYWLGH